MTRRFIHLKWNEPIVKLPSDEIISVASGAVISPRSKISTRLSHYYEAILFRFMYIKRDRVVIHHLIYSSNVIEMSVCQQNS